MDVQILHNESFAMLSVSCGYSKNTLEEIMIKRMLDESLISLNQNVHGKSIQQIAFEKKYDIFDLMNVLFPEGVKNTEVMELMDSIILKNIITVEYWMNTSDGYDNRYIKIETFDEFDALEKAKNSPSTRLGKDFKIYNKQK